MTTEKEPEKSSIFREYFSRVKAFRSNARFYLITVFLNGATMGVFSLLFNFFVLSLGYDEALLGKLITTSNTSALILVLPLGYVVDLWGRKEALMARTVLLVGAVAAMAFWPSVGMFFVMNVVFGIAQALSSVAMGPFLMENSSEAERTYLFSFSFGVMMLSQFAGNWVGGYLPTWVGKSLVVVPTSSLAYAGALKIVALVGLLGIIPWFFVRYQSKQDQPRSIFAPIALFKDHPKLLGKLFFPALLIAIGAGLFVPFMNVFFKVVHNQPDPVIGSLMAWGSLAMAVGFLIAPPMADRLGKLRLVVITQSLSIPFMLILGFVPIFGFATVAFYVRMALMNMSNPVYQNFVLEQVKPESQATAASMQSMIWSSGRAFSSFISGNLQVAYGFGPPFAIASGLYAIAIFLYWFFFLRRKVENPVVVVPAD